MRSIVTCLEVTKCTRIISEIVCDLNYSLTTYILIFVCSVILIHVKYFERYLFLYIYSWNQLMPFGAAALISSMVLVATVLKV